MLNLFCCDRLWAPPVGWVWFPSLRYRPRRYSIVPYVVPTSIPYLWAPFGDFVLCIRAFGWYFFFGRRWRVIMRSGSGRVHRVEADTREEEDQGWWAAGPPSWPVLCWSVRMVHDVPEVWELRRRLASWYMFTEYLIIQIFLLAFGWPMNLWSIGFLFPVRDGQLHSLSLLSRLRWWLGCVGSIGSLSRFQTVFSSCYHFSGHLAE